MSHLIVTNTWPSAVMKTNSTLSTLQYNYTLIPVWCWPSQSLSGLRSQLTPAPKTSDRVYGGGRKCSLLGCNRAGTDVPVNSSFPHPMMRRSAAPIASQVLPSKIEYLPCKVFSNYSRPTTRRLRTTIRSQKAMRLSRSHSRRTYHGTHATTFSFSTRISPHQRAL